MFAEGLRDEKHGDGHRSQHVEHQGCADMLTGSDSGQALIR